MFVIKQGRGLAISLYPKDIKVLDREGTLEAIVHDMPNARLKLQLEQDNSEVKKEYRITPQGRRFVVSLGRRLYHEISKIGFLPGYREDLAIHYWKPRTDYAIS